MVEKNKIKFETEEIKEYKFNFIFDEKNNSYIITFGSKKFEFNLKEEYVIKEIMENILFMEIFSNQNYFQIFFEKKQKRKSKEITKITNYHHYTALENFFDTLLLKTKNSLKKENDKKNYQEADKCCICLCDFYDDILDYSMVKIKEQLFEDNETDVIFLKKCEDHYFHSNCILSYINKKEFIKCPLCTKIYGIQTGLLLIFYLDNFEIK